jgi:hypothetical protein
VLNVIHMHRFTIMYDADFVRARRNPSHIARNNSCSLPIFSKTTLSDSKTPFAKISVVPYSSHICEYQHRLSGRIDINAQLGWLRVDVGPVISEAILAYKNIDSWLKPEKAQFDLNFFVFSPKIHKEPKGVVLIISPFNYPLWCLAPIVSVFL